MPRHPCITLPIGENPADSGAEHTGVGAQAGERVPAEAEGHDVRRQDPSAERAGRTGHPITQRHHRGEAVNTFSNMNRRDGGHMEPMVRYAIIILKRSMKTCLL